VIHETISTHTDVAPPSSTDRYSERREQSLETSLLVFVSNDLDTRRSLLQSLLQTCADESIEVVKGDADSDSLIRLDIRMPEDPRRRTTHTCECSIAVADGSFADIPRWERIKIGITTKLVSLWVFLLYGRWLNAPLPSCITLPTRVLQNLKRSTQGLPFAAEISAQLLASGAGITEKPFLKSAPHIDRNWTVLFPTLMRAVGLYIKHWVGRPISIPSERKTSDWRSIVYGISRIFVGLLLLAGGLSKLLTPHPIPIGDWFVLPAPLVGVCGLLESLIGLACVSFVPYRMLSTMVGVLFASFCGLLLVQWFAGESSCQCLGAVSPPIPWMLALDVSVLASIFVFRRQWTNRLRIENRFVDEQFRNARLVVPFLLALGTWFFGSVDGLFGFLSGSPLVVESSSQGAMTISPNERAELVYFVRNITSRDLTLVGARASCRCVAIQDLPLTIRSKEVQPIRVSIYGRASRGMQRESAVLIEQDSAFQLPLKASVIVRSDPPLPPRSQ
jgi:hypothetical protein